MIPADTVRISPADERAFIEQELARAREEVGRYGAASRVDLARIAEMEFELRRLDQAERRARKDA